MKWTWIAIAIIGSLLSTVAVLGIRTTSASDESCDCTWVNGGCRVQTPPSSGWKCKCERGWFWQRVCRGVVNKCYAGESCPANCDSKLCCRAGGGNCKGYPKQDTNMAAFKMCLIEKKLLRHLVERHTSRSYYDELNHQWNLALRKVEPLAYFLPNTTAHVQGVVQCGVSSSIHLIPNSGAQSYEGFSFGGGDSVIVDLREMNKIQVHPTNRTATIGPGALIGPIQATLWANGRYGMSTANCLTIGLGGHVISGGGGYYSNQYGMPVDNVLEFTVVDPKGRALTASPNSHPDLYWAFRGVGLSYFGIVTQFKMRMFDAKPIKMTFVNLNYNNSQFTRVLGAFQEFTNWVKINEPTVAYGLVVIPALTKIPLFPAPPGTNVQIYQIQDPTMNSVGNASVLAAIDSIFPKEGLSTMHTYGIPHIDFVTFTSYVPIKYNGQVFTNLLQPGAPPMTSLNKTMNLPRYLRTKSFFVKRIFRVADLEKIGQVVDRMPSDVVRIHLLDESGAIWKVGKNESAYAHRDAIYQVIAVFESLERSDMERGMAWLEEFWSTIQFMDGGDTCQCLPDGELPNYLTRYYGPNLRRLRDIKSKYDPLNYFNQSQSIPIN